LHIYGYHFENNGLGPAIIDTIYAVIGDSQYHLYSGHDWINVLRKLDLDSQFDGNVDKNIYGRGVAIRTGEKSNLITFEDTLNTGKTKLWNNAIVKLNFKIVYTSIYRDETFTSNSNFSKHPRF
jgi:hypothetical protein